MIKHFGPTLVILLLSAMGLFFLGSIMAYLAKVLFSLIIVMAFIAIIYKLYRCCNPASK